VTTVNITVFWHHIPGNSKESVGSLVREARKFISNVLPLEGKWIEKVGWCKAREEMSVANLHHVMVHQEVRHYRARMDRCRAEQKKQTTFQNHSFNPKTCLSDFSRTCTEYPIFWRLSSRSLQVCKSSTQFEDAETRVSFP
jgi:hypothetical protein